MVRRRKTLVAAILLLMGVSSSRGDTGKQVSSFQSNWDNHRAVTFVLETDTKGSGPGDFTRLRIQVPGQKELVLTNDNGWVRFTSKDAELSPELQKLSKNLLPSEYVLALKVAPNRTLLFLFGYPYGSAPGSLDAIEISASGHPRVVLHRDEFGLKDVHDLDGDGLAEIVGYPCLSQESGEGVLSYDPFNVYKLGTVASTIAILSIPLSKTYNLKHYYGWAGSECREDIRVVLHPPHGGKPIIIPKKEADAMARAKP